MYTDSITVYKKKKKKKEKKRILFIAVHKDSSYFIHVASNVCAECRRASNIELFVSVAR